MDDTFTAGDFKVTISGPYPVWVNVELAGAKLPSFRHDELSDLEHVLKRARQAAVKALGKDANEVL